MITDNELNLRQLRGQAALTFGQWMTLTAAQKTPLNLSRTHPLHWLELTPQNLQETTELLQESRAWTLPAPTPAASRTLEAFEDATDISPQNTALDIPGELLGSLIRINLITRAAEAWGEDRVGEVAQLGPVLRRELIHATSGGLDGHFETLWGLLRVSAPHQNYRLLCALLVAGPDESPTENEKSTPEGKLLDTATRITARLRGRYTGGLELALIQANPHLGDAAP